MSTYKIEQIESDCLDTSEAPFKLVVTNYDNYDEENKRSFIIFRDGDHTNRSETNVIDRSWFELEYDFESFLEDYFLIHRLSKELEMLKPYIFSLTKEQIQEVAKIATV
jgi:hypothetical protein